MLPALGFSSLKSGLFPHVDHVELVFLEESGYRDVQEVEFPEDIGDVELVGDLVDGLLKLLDPWPLRLAADQIEDKLEIVGQEGEEVEGL